MESLAHRFLAVTLASLLVCGAGGCEGAAIEANRQQVQAQQARIEQMQSEIAALKAQQSTSASYTAPPPGACDRAVMKVATKRGGDRFAAGDLSKALGYYHDALTACPGDATAELNLAHTYESMGNRDQALKYYRLSAAGTDPAEHAAAEQARAALRRLSH
jgi:tetratricopeptide (TPR) repeat protein